MSESKEFTLQEVTAHNTKKDLYMVIHDKVYDCTSFVDEHPYVPLQSLPLPLWKWTACAFAQAIYTEPPAPGSSHKAAIAEPPFCPYRKPHRPTPPLLPRQHIPRRSKPSQNANNVNSGGEEVLLDVGGQDGSEAFEDVGHSDEAREILDGLLVGTVKRMVRDSNFPLHSCEILTFPAR